MTPHSFKSATRGKTGRGPVIGNRAATTHKPAFRGYGPAIFMWLCLVNLLVAAFATLFGA